MKHSTSRYFAYLDFLKEDRGIEPDITHLHAAFYITRERAAEVLEEWKKHKHTPHPENWVLGN